MDTVSSNILLQEYGLEGYVVAENIALSASALVVFLMLFLVYRVVALYKHGQQQFLATQEELMPELLTQLHNFARRELEVVRDESGKLGFIANKNDRGEVGLFFIGAVEFVVKKNALSTSQRHQLIVQVLQDNMNFTAKEISKVYSHAIAVCSNSPAKNTAKLGAKAFKNYSTDEITLKDKGVEKVSLASVLNGAEATAKA